MDISTIIQELGVVGVMAGGLIYLIKFLTRDFKDEITEMKDILIKLIDKINNLKETIDKGK